jgi:hypothetical protein
MLRDACYHNIRIMFIVATFEKIKEQTTDLLV